MDQIFRNFFKGRGNRFPRDVMGMGDDMDMMEIGKYILLK
jgi:hypothetical protein